mmetsp:Transcript_116801/g.362933  ORF Transcript_116801/g.362933 Transcript_116801/m.362933 type:complete len:307 (+) Transcript_116801:507-1427(+)
MLPRPPRAEPLSAGCGLFTSSAILPATEALGLVLAAMLPRAVQAAAATRGCGSSSKKTSWSSHLAPASPSLPSATAQAMRTSESGCARASASLGAERAAALPRAPSAVAAAHAGLRMAAGVFACTPAMDIMRDAVSSSASARAASRASTCASSSSPRPPRAAAAATRTPTAPLPRSLAISAACAAALEPWPVMNLTALMRTYTSESSSSLQAAARCFSPSSLGIAPMAAARTRASWLLSMPMRASASMPRAPRPRQAPTTTSTSACFSFAASFPAAEVTFMLPSAMQASITRSRSWLSRKLSTASL